MDSGHDHHHDVMNHDHQHVLMQAVNLVDHSDHDHDHGDSNGEDHVGHMMMMVFHFGFKETILIDQWSTDSVTGFILSMILIAFMGTLYEGLKYYREYLFWKTYNSLQYRAVTLPEKGAVVGVSTEDNARVQPSMWSTMHIFQTLLHLFQVTLSFLLMLIFMTYNVWLCLAVVFGASFGYFLFGWKKSVIVDVTEHCH